MQNIFWFLSQKTRNKIDSSWIKQKIAVLEEKCMLGIVVLLLVFINALSIHYPWDEYCIQIWKAMQKKRNEELNELSWQA